MVLDEKSKAMRRLMDAVEVNPMGPSNKCRDHDEDCEAIKAGALRCWLHDPSQGWCPYLKQDS